MTESSAAFGSPEHRGSVVFLQHVAGFEVKDADGGIAFVTPADLEQDAEFESRKVRKILRGEHNELTDLSEEFILRNLALPILPVGFYGDETDSPVILGAKVTVNEPEPSDDTLEYAKGNVNTITLGIAPTLGRLARVSCIRSPRLGGYGIDWFVSSRTGSSISLLGGSLQVNIDYDQHE